MNSEHRAVDLATLRERVTAEMDPHRKRLAEAELATRTARMYPFRQLLGDDARARMIKRCVEAYQVSGRRPTRLSGEDMDLFEAVLAHSGSEAK